MACLWITNECSDRNVFQNEIAFPLCNATDILWNRNIVRCRYRCFGDIRVGVRVRNGDILRHWFPLVHWMSVATSDLLPWERDRQTGSFTARCCAFLAALQTKSFSCAWRIWCGELFLQESPCRSFASTAALKIYVWNWQVIFADGDPPPLV